MPDADWESTHAGDDYGTENGLAHGSKHRGRGRHGVGKTGNVSNRNATSNQGSGKTGRSGGIGRTGKAVDE